ncbi:tRNA(His) guanylyltransferase Thg1 family protein [Methanobacterium alcaliphilum]|uniref:tRNA(His) guanylyltransferase Thg1 family protein n=1 Tax=Methanobacterium alcaliphilum TaxID=392018 RepID=UPI00200A2BA0|nr:tRNA(His) guanylyltransferase Thg1 family protein [Methanobacterium alcaliphilum]MCK9150334.1 guanylyltransferase [Methanobacterium alcaliphilum]
MREYEIFSNLKMPGGSRILLRLDGRGFYNFSKNIGLKKPFDPFFAEVMVNTAINIFREFAPSFIYTFSDEFNIVLDDVPFSGRLEKIDSVFASFTATSFLFNWARSKFLEKSEIKNEELFKTLSAVSFDCRVIPLSRELVGEYFKQRQNEAWRNCLNGYTYWTLRKEMGKNEAMANLNGLKSNQMHELLFKRGINIAEVPSWQKRGVGVYKVNKKVVGYNPLTKEEVSTTRKKISTNWDLPLFSDDFFKVILDK